MRLGKHETTGELVALKIIRKDGVNWKPGVRGRRGAGPRGRLAVGALTRAHSRAQMQKQIEGEVSAMQRISVRATAAHTRANPRADARAQHPNSLHLIHVDLNATYVKKRGQVLNVVLLVIEFAKGARRCTAAARPHAASAADALLAIERARCMAARALPRCALLFGDERARPREAAGACCFR